MLNQDLIETLILKEQFKKSNFSFSSLERYTSNKKIQDQVYQQMIKIFETAGNICDKIRDTNNTSFENFANQLQKTYTFSNSQIIKELYNYGMFVSR